MSCYFRLFLLLSFCPASWAQVSELRLVSHGDLGKKDPAVIAWKWLPGPVSYYVVEGKRDDGSWTQFRAVAKAVLSTTLWKPFCTIRVGAVHEDLLSPPNNYSKPLEICASLAVELGPENAPDCHTLGEFRQVDVSTTDRAVLLEWDVAVGDNVSSYKVEMKQLLGWREVAHVPASSIPSQRACITQAARVHGLSPKSKYSFRVTATVQGKLAHSDSLSVTTKSSQCSTSLLGEPLFDPNDEATAAVFSIERVKAQLLYNANQSEFNTVWLARVDGFLYNWDNAFDLLAGGWQRFPGSFRIPRHVGHRLLGRRQVENATTWLEHAREHVRGKEATAEFFPIEFRLIPLVPKSSSQFNIYYHLGLSYFLAGNYTAAAAVYEEGFHWSFTEYDEGDDAFIAASYWLVNLYHRIGTPSALEASAKLLMNVSSDKSTYHIVENLGWGYYYGLLLFKGDAAPEDVLAMASTQPGLALDTYGYAVAQYLFVQSSGEKRRQARQLMVILQADPMWSAFGYIGAEYDIFRQDSLNTSILI